MNVYFHAWKAKSLCQHVGTVNQHYTNWTLLGNDFNKKNHIPSLEANLAPAPYSPDLVLPLPLDHLMLSVRGQNTHYLMKQNLLPYGDQCRCALET